MTFPIQSLLSALAPHCAKLVGPAALERIVRLASRLPAIGSYGSFELHLGSGEDRADLLVSSDDQGGRRKLSRALEQDDLFLIDPALRPLLAEWTLPGALLCERTSLIWLEYDLPGGRESRLPMVYFGLLGLSAGELGNLAQRSRQILTGRAVEDAQIRALELCVRSLPANGQITFLADQSVSRGIQHLRLIVQLPREQAWSWLERIGWPGSRARWEQASWVFMNGPAYLSLYLDVADSVGPTLGVESMFPGPESAAELWEDLAERLVGLGATTAEESAAVIAWAGTETADLPGIESLVRIDRIPGFKLVLDARGAIAAKGYLAFKARETLF